jgi:putative GTP pyrophosphokinase
MRRKADNLHFTIESRTMGTEISKTQIDRLGDRLRKGSITDSDLRLLDQYRRSFTEAYEMVAGAIRNQLGLEPTGRPAKSTTSIAEKLQRESIRLTQIQDIAGCRLIVPDISEQDRLVASLVKLFSDSTVIDRREKPSHGYRAVHVIVAIEKKTVEIQVRTALQQEWAEVSEKLADLIDPAIKYGRGNESTVKILAAASHLVAVHEQSEVKFLEAQQLASRAIANASLTDGTRDDIISLQREVDSFREMVTGYRAIVFKELREFTRDLPE